MPIHVSIYAMRKHLRNTQCSQACTEHRTQTRRQLAFWFRLRLLPHPYRHPVVNIAWLQPILAGIAPCCFSYTYSKLPGPYMALLWKQLAAYVLRIVQFVVGNCRYRYPMLHTLVWWAAFIYDRTTCAYLPTRCLHIFMFT